ncbi:hypothetical protein OO007_20030 [Cocleimonas sp. KMM 6892]|uniref:hypothetical protein n=1 Tax=unclassified Cocleimonas TaxID=2639732 RepID=UPI002DB69A15|nr:MULTISPECIES: hypothetical protein [unclassified Cocleimonas]MEB8434538.1 hypothetical protein [Cocleimonas sp. KMM 6892]MEC4717431.1 hypothetical protein [Cocleimonas sp. KMM 6895]MEC4746775.1 hypothetical protein [Cocleimonas sp. KMM 6896]
MTPSCPQCGYLIDTGATKLMSCPSCNSSIYIQNNTTSLSDLNVVKNTDKYLFDIGHSVQIKNASCIPKGYSLYEYEDGFRVEWELVDNDQNTYILNQEEENLFFVKQIPKIEAALPAWSSMQPNTQLIIETAEWLVVEKREVNFVAFYGELQNLPLQNSQIQCSYLSNTEGECLVLVSTGQPKSGSAHYPYTAYQGWWLDPMDLVQP